MERSVAANVLDIGTLALILGTAYGVFLLLRNWEDIVEYLDPIKRAEKTLSGTADDYNAWIFGVDNDLLEQMRREVLERQSLIDVIYGHIAEIGPLGTSLQFTTGYGDGTATL